MPSQVWADPAVRDALAAWEIGVFCRLVRERAGLRQEDLAHLAGLSQGFLSQLEAGKRRLTDIDKIIELLDGLQTPVELLPAPSRRALGDWETAAIPPTASLGDPMLGRDRQLAESPVDRREFLAGSAALAAFTGLPMPKTTKHLGRSDVLRLRRAAQALYALDDHHGGRAVYAHTLSYLNDTRGLLDTASFGPTVGRDLQVICGQVTEMAGWLAFDGGDQDTARRLFTEALTVAQITDSNQLATLVLTSMSLQVATWGTGREALDLAEAAQRSARPYASPRLLSLLAAREGLAHARLGNQPRCYEQLLRAEQFLDEGDTPGEDEDWLAFWGPADLAWTAASAHLALGAPADGEKASRTALNHVDRDYPRNKGLYLSRLAQCLAATGDIDQAALTATAALDCSTSIECGRLDDDLSAVRTQLAPHATVPAVDDYLRRSERLMAA